MAAMARAVDPPDVSLPRVFNDCQKSQACHRRCVKELVKCRRQFSSDFVDLWIRCVVPLFTTMKKEPTVERLVKFVASFATYRDDNGEDCDLFVEKFLKFLVSASDASNKSVRYRSIQILSEIICTLAEEAEVNVDLWMEMKTCIQRRMQDKIPGIRMFAARALGRLFSAEDNNVQEDPIILQYRQCLSADQSADVRKAAVASLPILDATISDIVERTIDTSDAVRKAAYSVIASSIPIRNMSIRQRALVLQRGLADTSSSVRKECSRMLRETWFSEDCEMDVLKLLRYLDVETNEKAGEAVMEDFLKEGAFEIVGTKGLRDYFSECDSETGLIRDDVRLLEPEEAIYWRMLCTYLNDEAQAKRLEAANSRGTKADVLEAEAADKAELLDAILPPSVADFVVMVEAHLSAGHNHAFVSRQLVMLAQLLDFSDAASRKAAAALIDNILQKLTSEDHIIGDGIYLGGEKDWSDAVVQLSRKVHASEGAFEEAFAKIVVELGRPCREGGANALQWLRCLAVMGLLLQNLRSLKQLPHHLIDSQEIVNGLLTPATMNSVPGVQRAGAKCLSLYSQLEDKPTPLIVLKLKDLLFNRSVAVRSMAIEGLFDLLLCHGPALDQATGTDHFSGPIPEPRAPSNHLGTQFPASDQQNINVPVLEALASVLSDSTDMAEHEGLDAEAEPPKCLAAYGFTKLLVQGRTFPELQKLQTALLPKLFHLYFDEAEDIPRLKQWLALFFHTYASISSSHKKCIASVFVPTMRAEWPGITSSGNPHVATARKKAATQLSRFMLELIKQPLFKAAAKRNDDSGEVADELPDEGQEHLAISIAKEVVKVSSRKPTLVKAYRSALCKVLVLLEVRPALQPEIKCMRKLLDLTMEVMAGEKLILKELRGLASRLKDVDNISEEVLTVEQLQTLLESLGLDFNLSEQASEEAAAPTPARTSKKPKQTPRTASTMVASDEDDFETPKVARPRQQHGSKTDVAVQRSSRSQRTCKTTAMQKMQVQIQDTHSRAIYFDEEESEDEEDEEEEESEESDDDE